MKKVLIAILTLSLVLSVTSISFGAAKKAAPAKKPVEVRKAVAAPKPIAKPASAPAGNRGFAAKGGLIGGAGTALVGYYFPAGRLDSAVYAGYGIGNKYNVMALQLEGIFKLSAMNVILSVDYANYSELVRNIPGLAGDTAKGGHAGLGLAIGRDFGKMEARIGYSSALGVIASLGYKF